MGQHTKLAIGLLAALLFGAAALLLGPRGKGGETLLPPAVEQAEDGPGPAELSLPPGAEGAPPAAEVAAEAARREVELGPAAAETAVLVEVRTVESEAPVANVAVRLGIEDESALGEEPGGRPTDAAGCARFPLRHGTPLLAVLVAAGPETTGTVFWANRAVESGREVRITVHVTAGGSVAGTVVDEAGRAVPAAAVRGWCRSWRSRDPGRAFPPDREVAADSAGRFRVEHLGEDFTLEASAPGLMPAGGLAGALSPGQELEGVLLVVAAAGSIPGRVLDPARAPLAGVEVQAVSSWTPADADPAAVGGATRLGPPPAKATTAGDGGFLLAGLAPHPYEVRVTADGLAPWERTHSPAHGFLEIVLARGIELTGWVLDPGGTGIPGAEVRLRSTARAEARTNEEGFFRLPGLVPDPSAILYATAPGHAIQVVQPVEIRADLPNTITVRLEPGRVIAGRVVDREGTGVADAAVEIEGDRVVSLGSGHMIPTPTWERRLGANAARTDAAGAFRLDRLYAGTFEVTATHPADPSQKAMATVESGIEDLLLRLDPEAVWDVRIAGRVTDAATGAPVRSFEVQPWSTDPGWSHALPLAVENEDGAYELRGLAPGKIRLWFTSPGYAQESVEEREYAAGEHRLYVALAPARDLALRLLGRDRQPIAGATLWIRAPGKEILMFEVEGEPYRTPHATLDGQGEARLHSLPAGPVTLLFGGFLAEENPRFELDLTVPLEGVQEFVIDAERSRRLTVLLLGADPGARGGPVVEIRDQEGWNALVKGRTDVGPLVAPSFALEVRDEKGEVRATASGTRDAGGGWQATWTQGNSTVRTNLLDPLAFELAVPAGPLDIDVRAEGHRPFHAHLPPEALTPTGEGTLGWALLLEREG
ncbi:MAG: carboxypeptidase-like regulatory domain-containing protein [Planctomycetota bacterium]